MSETRAVSRATLQLLPVALAVLTTPVTALAAGPPVPTWPQNFYTNAMERDSFGLPVTAPGAIIISVHALGAPIVVALTRPDGSRAQQVAGTGDLQMSYGAAPAEVAVSPLWRIGIALQQPAPGAEARGSVQVQEPPIDARALAAFLAKPKLPRTPPNAKARAGVATQHQAKIDATKRAFEQARAAAQAARFEAVRPRLEAAKARAAVATRAVLSPNVAIAPSSRLPTGTVQRPSQSISLPPPPPPPVIALPLYTDQVEPGDTIPLAGSGFGAQGPASAVHFILGGATGDYVAPVSVWTDSEIFMTVPAATGYLRTLAAIYVIRNTDGAQSQPVNIVFNPTIDLQVYPLPPQNPLDSVIPGYDEGWCRSITDTQNPWPVNGWAHAWAFGWVPCDGAGGAITGYKSNDVFFQTIQLKNGWVLDHADVTPFVLTPCFTGAEAFWCGAYVSTVDPAIPGANSPRVNVRVWADADPFGDNHPEYQVDVYVRGPKGIPFQ